MTHEEYRSLLINIKEGKLDSREKMEQLNKIYQIKPVSLLWNAVKAECILESGGELSEAYDLLSVANMDYETERNIEGNMVLHRLDDIAGDVAMGNYREFELAQCTGDTEFLTMRLEKERKEERKFLDEGDTDKLSKEYISDCKIVSYYILEKYSNFLCPGRELKHLWTETDIPNMGFVKETIEQKKDVILCVSSEMDYTEIYILGFVLLQMGCKVFIINFPVQIETDVPVKMQETVAISMDNMSIENEMSIIPAIELICEGKSVGNNVAEIIAALTMNNTEHRILLAASWYIEQLAKTEILRKNIQNLYIQAGEWKKNHISFAWVGSYLSYIGEIYDLDVAAVIHRIPECRFSIVIPARNSSVTLRHTLKTCLNQRYTGNYEIVISDNSSDGNTEIYRMVQEMNDEHIRYFRTPRELPLPKSFEFAILQTRGEYIFSLGSDDALLPWTLEVLEEVVNHYPDDEIIYWERGFYAWPGFNGGQENQFVIPGRYKKGQYNEEYIASISFLTASLKVPQHMYAMPLLYINSMFKRSYFDTLLSNTGRLWDGICQDIYMGVITTLIVPHILSLSYPLSIAGMSAGSVGATSNTATAEVSQGRAFWRDASKIGNIGSFAMSETEMLFPEVTTDVSSFYNCFLKAVARGLLPESILSEENGIDWKGWFINCYRTLDKKDVYFSQKMQKFRYAAIKHGEEFLKWFDENIYAEALKPEILPERDKTSKTYQEYDDERGIMIDASKYGVHNSYEASLLFEKLSGL